jgi:glycosyltransferase involved in cell wall biosynthesis
MNIMVDSWYADYLDYDGFPFHSWLENRPWYSLLRPLISRIGLIRGTLLYLCARQSSGTVVACDTPGFWTFLLLRAMAGSPGECFVLEFIRRRPLRFINRFIYPLWFNIVAAPSFRKAVSRAQVMTSWERRHYADMFCVDEDRFVHIPFPMIRSESSYKPVNKTSGDYVMSSGRVSCDWGTLICAVADLPQYPVTIVHSKKDLRKFRHMTLPANVKLLCDIPYEEHNRLLERAVCYVIALFDTVGSTGHARLSHAIHLGVPVIVTRVSGIEEYVKDGETAIVVPQGDPVALREAIQRVMENPTLQKLLAENAIRNQNQWTRQNYFDCLSDMVKNELCRLS